MPLKDASPELQAEQSHSIALTLFYSACRNLHDGRPMSDLQGVSGLHANGTCPRHAQRQVLHLLQVSVKTTEPLIGKSQAGGVPGGGAE